jgi:hypothetical protein
MIAKHNPQSAECHYKTIYTVKHDHKIQLFLFASLRGAINHTINAPDRQLLPLALAGQVCEFDRRMCSAHNHSLLADLFYYFERYCDYRLQHDPLVHLLHFHLKAGIRMSTQKRACGPYFRASLRRKMTGTHSAL